MPIIVCNKYTIVANDAVKCNLFFLGVVFFLVVVHIFVITASTHVTWITFHYQRLPNSSFKMFYTMVSFAFNQIYLHIYIHIHIHTYTYTYIYRYTIVFNDFRY